MINEYVELKPTRTLLLLPVTDVLHVIKEINKMRYAAWNIEEQRIKKKERQLRKLHLI